MSDQKGTKKAKQTFVYATPKGKKQRIDCYIPLEDSKAPYPVVLLIHGGGWTSGSRKDEGRTARKFALKGYAAFSIDYRLAPKHIFPAQLDDCMTAMQWIVERTDKFNLDISQFALWGYSAGAHLATLLSVQEQWAARVTCVIAGGSPAYSFDWLSDSSDDAVFFLGTTKGQNPLPYAQASPMENISPRVSHIRYYLYHGDRDLIAPSMLFQAFADKLSTEGKATVKAYLLEGANHMSAALDYENIDRAMLFLDECVSCSNTRQGTDTDNITTVTATEQAQAESCEKGKDTRGDEKRGGTEQTEGEQDAQGEEKSESQKCEEKSEGDKDCPP